MMFFVEEFIIFVHIFIFVSDVDHKLVFLMCFGKEWREVFYIFGGGCGDHLQLCGYYHWSCCWTIMRRCQFAVIFRWGCATIRSSWGNCQDLFGVVWRGRPKVVICLNFLQEDLIVHSFRPIFFQLEVWEVILYLDNFWFFIHIVVPIQQFHV